ncbi:MAG: SDR family oxidoreductase [Pseudomonadota bacterium]
MSDRSILITGCSTGIGYHCAHGMKKRGWRVFATARKPEDIERLEAEGLETFYLDYAEPASIAACAEDVLKATDGRLFALFNNGAYGQPGAVEDLSTEVLRAQFDANFFGWHDLTCRLLPSMREQGRGRIVQNSSVLGLVAMKWRGAYNASKFALEGLTDTMRLELRGSAIHVSLIEPGPVVSNFVPTALKHFEKNIDTENSAHMVKYAEQLARMKGTRQTSAARFRLGPEAVLAKLVHAVESERPKAHYYVTTPTYLMAGLKRVLPQRLLDPLLSRFSDN